MPQEHGDTVLWSDPSSRHSCLVAQGLGCACVECRPDHTDERTEPGTVWTISKKLSLPEATVCANMTSYDISPGDVMESLPLSEPVLLVLLSLAEQPRHGYSILKDVERISGGRVVLSTGTLYGALQRLLAQGWIERIEEDEPARDRRSYRLTSKGRRNLQAEIERMRSLTKVAGLRIARKEA